MRRMGKMGESPRKTKFPLVSIYIQENNARYAFFSLSLSCCGRRVTPATSKREKRNFTAQQNWESEKAR